MFYGKVLKITVKAIDPWNVPEADKTVLVGLKTAKTAPLLEHFMAWTLELLVRRGIFEKLNPNSSGD